MPLMCKLETFGRAELLLWWLVGNHMGGLARLAVSKTQLVFPSSCHHNLWLPLRRTLDGKDSLLPLEQLLRHSWFL